MENVPSWAWMTLSVVSYTLMFFFTLGFFKAGWKNNKPTPWVVFLAVVAPATIAFVVLFTLVLVLSIVITSVVKLIGSITTLIMPAFKVIIDAGNTAGIFVGKLLDS